MKIPNMSEWWGGKKANLDHMSFHMILNWQRDFVLTMEGKRRWLPREVLVERNYGAARAN